MDDSDLPRDEQLPEGLRRDLTDTQELLKKLADAPAFRKATEELAQLSSEAALNASKLEGVGKHLFQFEGLRDQINEMYRIPTPLLDQLREADELSESLAESMAEVHRQQAEREARRDAAADAAIETARTVADLAKVAEAQHARLDAIVGVLQQLANHAEREADHRTESDKAARWRFRWTTAWTIIGVCAAIVAAIAAVILL